MKTSFNNNRLSPRQMPSAAGFSMIEVVISMAIMAIVMAGIIQGYTMSAYRAEWSSYSLAAQSLANMKIEQFRAAKWDPRPIPPVDFATANFFPTTVDILDIPVSGENIVYATNVVTITLVSTDPLLKAVRVDTSWSFGKKVFFNTASTLRAPDQ